MRPSLGEIPTVLILTSGASHDFTRQVEAHHFCTHVSEHIHQCIIYDSDESNAKLIGIEYIVSEDVRIPKSRGTLLIPNAGLQRITSGRKAVLALSQV